MPDDQRPQGSCFLFHRWTKWSEPVPLPQHVWPLYQKRSCLRCNKQQQRSL